MAVSLEKSISKKREQKKTEYRNAEGNKMTFILVGTKSDRVFENGALFDEDDPMADLDRQILGGQNRKI